jgi:hypothetical protein
LKGGFLLGYRLPGLDRLIGNALSAGLDGINREIVQEAKDPLRDAICDMKDASEPSRRQNARLAQWQITDDRENELLELIIR